MQQKWRMIFFKMSFFTFFMLKMTHICKKKIIFASFL